VGAISAVQPLNVDIIVVNDGSTDTTSEDARRCGIPVLELPVNLGVGGAMQTGYRYARTRGYDIAIQFDADGQHNADYLRELAAVLEEGKADIAIGSRYAEGNQRGFRSTIMRRIGIRFFAWLIRIFTRERITDPTSGFRAANRKAISLFAQSYPHDYPEPESLVLAHNHGLRIREIPVEMFDRQGGSSTIKILDTVFYMVKVTTAILLETMRRKNRIRL
jgi:glycosyltransferase involved in cell wall biosynthesis